MKEKYPEWKALVQKPEVGAIIDLTPTSDVNDSDKEYAYIMSLEEAFEYQKTHYRGFCIERDKNKHDPQLPDEVRNYILDNMYEDENLPY